jgi:hypothetical protein
MIVNLMKKSEASEEFLFIEKDAEDKILDEMGVTKEQREEQDKLFKQNPYISYSERRYEEIPRYEQCYPFLDNFELCAVYKLDVKKQQLVMRKLDKYGSVEREGAIGCIHTAICTVNDDVYNRLKEDPELMEDVALNVKSIGSSEFLTEINLEAEEHYVALKSFVEKIAEAGMGAFRLQSAFDQINRAYPIVQPLLGFVAEHDHDAYLEFLSFIENECKGHEPCMIANLLPLSKSIEELSFGNPEKRDKAKLYLNELLEINPPMSIFRETPRLLMSEQLSNRADTEEFRAEIVALNQILQRFHDHYIYKVGNIGLETDGGVLSMYITDEPIFKVKNGKMNRFQIEMGARKNTMKVSDEVFYNCVLDIEDDQGVSVYSAEEIDQNGKSAIINLTPEGQRKGILCTFEVETGALQINCSMERDIDIIPEYFNDPESLYNDLYKISAEIMPEMKYIESYCKSLELIIFTE